MQDTEGGSWRKNCPNERAIHIALVLTILKNTNLGG